MRRLIFIVVAALVLYAFALAQKPAAQSSVNKSDDAVHQIAVSVVKLSGASVVSFFR